MSEAAQNAIVFWLRTLAARSRKTYLGEVDGFHRWLKSVGAALLPRDRLNAEQECPADQNDTALRRAAEVAAHLAALGSAAAHALVAEYLSAHDRDAPATGNRRLFTIQSLSAGMKRAGLTDWRIELKAGKAESYRDTRGPGPDAVGLILARISSELMEIKFRKRRIDKAARARLHRDRALIALMATEGLRRGEAADATFSGWDGRTRTLKITGKGRRQTRPIRVNTLAARFVTSWICHRRWMHKSNDEAKLLFCLSPEGVSAAVQDRARRAGVRLTAHGLRHTCITEAMRAHPGELSEVRKLSRHANLNVLEIYNDNIGAGREHVVRSVVDSIKKTARPRGHADRRNGCRQGAGKGQRYVAGSKNEPRP